MGSPSESPAGRESDPLAARTPAADLLPVLYAELKALAAARIEREGPGLTLQATALVHEAWLRLAGDRDPGWDGRAHFFASAARAMRRILVERARRANLIRRTSASTSAVLSGVATLGGEPDADVLALDEALTKLAVVSPRKAQVVELLHYAGLSIDETARLLEVSPSTIKSDWRFARSWLYRELAR